MAVVYDPLSRVTDFSYDVEKSLLAEKGVDLIVARDAVDANRHLPEARIVISSGLESIGAEQIERMSSCIGIVAAQAGLDHIDVDAATDAGIDVVNIHASTEDVADHALALTLAALRRVVDFHHAAGRREWDSLNVANRQDLRRLRGQVMGIIGPGRIGSAVAARARAFGFRLIATGRRPRPAPHPGTVGSDHEDAIEYASLEKLFEVSDVIVVCADANPSSVRLLDSDGFRKMKPGVVIVNVARGSLIDEVALADALDRGVVSMAALDVRDPEPPDPGRDRLTGHPRVIQTPHVAGASDGSREDLHRLTAERVLEVLEHHGLIEPTGQLGDTDMDLSMIHHLDQLEGIAEERLSPTTFGYVAGGAGQERAVRNNRDALDRISIVPRVMRDVADVSTATTVLGGPTRHPLIVAPSAVQRLSHPDGELATARAARDAGLTMVLSMNASTTMEDVSATGVDFWMQLYVSPDRGHMRGIVERAFDAGAKALCITVDHAGMPTRLRELHRPLVVPPDVQFVHLDSDPSKRGIDRTIDWGVVEWVRGVSDLPLLLKGVLHPEDGRLAAEAGVDGVIVSNHGGRQLDGAVSAYDVLVPLLEAVDGRAEVFADGGIRSGNDLFKVLALGARAGLIGRPVWWGLAAGGQAGVVRVLEILTTELEETMRLCGARTLDDVDRDMLTGYVE